MISDRSGATQGRPRSHADGPLKGPQSLKTAPRGLQRSSEAPRHARERFLSDCWAILGPPGPRKTSQSAVLSTIFLVSAISQGSRPQRPKKAPKGAPREAPGAAQEPPRRLQAPPGARQEAPKTEDPRGPKPPRRLQEALREPILASSWGPRGSFSSLLGVLFEPRARPARQTKALFEITGQKDFRDRCGPDVQRPLST